MFLKSSFKRRNSSQCLDIWGQVIPQNDWSGKKGLWMHETTSLDLKIYALWSGRQLSQSRNNTMIQQQSSSSSSNRFIERRTLLLNVKPARMSVKIRWFHVQSHFAEIPLWWFKSCLVNPQFNKTKTKGNRCTCIEVHECPFRVNFKTKSNFTWNAPGIF